MIFLSTESTAIHRVMSCLSSTQKPRDQFFLYAVPDQATERFGQKIVFYRQLTNLRMQILDSGSVAGELFLPLLNSSLALSSNCCFHCVIWFRCMSNCWASSDSVLSPFNAANATLALNSTEYFFFFCSLFFSSCVEIIRAVLSLKLLPNFWGPFLFLLCHYPCTSQC